MSLFKSTKQAEICPQCQAELQIKKGKQGLFLGCSNYPACDYLKPLHQTNHIIKQLTEICPECGLPLQLKQGSFGIFIGCSGYPDCHFIVQEQAEQEEKFDCPECGSALVSRKGRSGKHFYGCSRFPQCKFTLPTKPVRKTCPQCQCSLALSKRGKYQCVNKSCQHIFNDE